MQKSYEEIMRLYGCLALANLPPAMPGSTRYLDPNKPKPTTAVIDLIQHLIRSAFFAQRDPIFRDLFTRLAAAG